MSKIICDICGTRYPESADACPICGCVHTGGGKTAADDYIMDEERPVASGTYVRGGRFSKTNVRKRNQSYISDEEEVEAPYVKAVPVSQEPVDETYGFNETPQKRKSNVILNILLVIVIVALLCVSAYIFVEYFMPGIVGQVVPQVTEAYVEETEAPTEPEITEEPTTPCMGLEWVDADSDVVVLEAEGNSWLLNYVITPADTTDMVEYFSSDESVVTVDGEGCLTAVSEGQATVTIVCGAVELKCDVICSFVEETLAEETEVPEEIEATEETEAAEEDTQPTAPLKDVELKVNYTDISLTARGQKFTFKLTGLSNEEATWTSDNENVITVDNGTVTYVGKGKAYVTVTYGDQEVKIVIYCK